MAGGSAIRGSRVGAGPMGEAERGESIARFRVSYWCAKPSFAEDGTVEVPQQWDCPRCGFPAGQDKNKPPMPMKNEPYKTHLAYVKERRTEAEANKVLEIALKKIRGDD